MVLVKNDSHVAQALAHRTERFKAKVRYGQVIEIYAKQVQQFEDAAFDVLAIAALTSTGAQLDALGEIVGEERFGRDDAAYLIAIEARILINKSTGTTEDILAILSKLTGDPAIEHRDEPVATYVAEITDDLDLAAIDMFRVAALVHSAEPSGVRGIIEFHDSGAFAYDVGPGYDIGKYGSAL